MVRAVRFAPWIDAALVLRSVLRRIPATRGEIEPADERDGIVDDDDLLMLRAGDRVAAVQAEAKAPVRAPRQSKARHELALQRVDDGEIPIEHVDAQRAAPAHQTIEKCTDQILGAGAGIFRV